jgi:hypothetical protein
MRNGQNKRMRGRNRNKGHHGHHNPLTRVYESNGPDVKIRGTAHHVAEKYLQLARDAMASGDPVTAENHYQHAEHYFRLIAAAQDQLRQQNPYYQPAANPGEGTREEAFGDDGDEMDQPMQGQPSVGSPQPYPPREQPQPYGGPQQPQQGRPPHQAYQQFPQPSPPQQFQPQPYVQPAGVPASDGERLPPFITGAPPQQSPQAVSLNGHDPQGGDRFPRHRRRRHRGGPRPDVTNMREVRSDEGSDDPRPGNS